MLADAGRHVQCNRFWSFGSAIDENRSWSSQFHWYWVVRNGDVFCCHSQLVFIPQKGRKTRQKSFTRTNNSSKHHHGVGSLSDLLGCTSSVPIIHGILVANYCWRWWFCQLSQKPEDDRIAIRHQFFSYRVEIPSAKYGNLIGLPVPSRSSLNILCCLRSTSCAIVYTCLMSFKKHDKYQTDSGMILLNCSSCSKSKL